MGGRVEEGEENVMKRQRSPKKGDVSTTTTNNNDNNNNNPVGWSTPPLQTVASQFGDHDMLTAAETAAWLPPAVADEDDGGDSPPATATTNAGGFRPSSSSRSVLSDSLSSSSLATPFIPSGTSPPLALSALRGVASTSSSSQPHRGSGNAAAGRGGSMLGGGMSTSGGGSLRRAGEGGGVPACQYVRAYEFQGKSFLRGWDAKFLPKTQMAWELHLPPPPPPQQRHAQNVNDGGSTSAIRGGQWEDMREIPAPPGFRFASAEEEGAYIAGIPLSATAGGGEEGHRAAARGVMGDMCGSWRLMCSAEGSWMYGGRQRDAALAGSIRCRGWERAVIPIR